MGPEPQTRWLSEDEMRAWLALVGVLRTLPSTLDSELRSSSSMSMFDYLTLAMLSQAPERTLSCSELARQVDGTLSRISHALDRFADHGWVERTHDDDDRRVTHVRLTDDGMAVVRNIAPAHVASVRGLVFDHLSPADVADLERICTVISQAARDRS